uniref:Uncharacterized protein n=1 Tax=Bracon brevicornis TaxID=1563983 RepID=A0A6V7JGV9_9HYME
MPNEPEIQLQNPSEKLILNNKGSKSPSSPLPYHTVDVNPDTPPTKRRKCRETNSNSEKKSASCTGAIKDLDDKAIDQETTPATDPIEIIPLMPSLKMEMPEYLEQDGSSCSYGEQSAGDGSNKLEDTFSTAEEERKPDISQTFYTNQTSSDASKTKTDLGNFMIF